MAYIRNGFAMVSDGTHQLIIDDFDGGIDISADGDMATTRPSTNGRTIASIQKHMMYSIEVNVPPFSATMERIENYFEDMKKRNFPDLTITIYEQIDGRYRITSYTNGNFKSALDFETAASDEAPKGKIAFFGTRGTPEYKTTI